MEQLKQDFLEHAFSVYLDYAQAWQRREQEEPALVFPLSYIAFARQQPRLFEALFVRHMDLDMTRPEDFYREPGNGDRAADFARAVGLCTASVANLKCADEKISLGYDFIEPYR